MAELRITEVINQYENIWLNISSIPEKPKGIMVLTDENSCRVRPGDYIQFCGDKLISWRRKGLFTDGIFLKRIDKKNYPRPELTAQTIFSKERQQLLDQIKGLECELRTQSDSYEHEIKEMNKRFAKKINCMASGIVNCRIYSMLVSVIAFVSTYLHFS